MDNDDNLVLVGVDKEGVIIAMYVEEPPGLDPEDLAEHKREIAHDVGLLCMDGGRVERRPVSQLRSGEISFGEKLPA